MYGNVQLHIDGIWRDSLSGKTIPVINPATEDQIGHVAFAQREDLELAVLSAEKGFKVWRKVSPFDRSKIMRKAAELLRQRSDVIAELMTLEQGEPIAEARAEVMSSADVLDGARKKPAAPTAA